jgi:hypothetical protein
VGKRLDLDKIAVVLVEAMYYGDTQTADRWGISTKTIQRYRNQFNDDPYGELSRIVQIKKDKFETEWANEIPAAIRAALRFLMRAAEEADHKNPDVIHAIAGGMKIAAEIGLTKDMIDARLGRLDRPNTEENRPLDAIDSGGNNIIDGDTK